MKCSVFLFSLFLFTPCAQADEGYISAEVAAAVANPQRPAEDVAKDVNRKPAEVLTFFAIEPGMTVLDLFSGGGYYTEMLNSVVGPEGTVIAHTNEAYIPFSGESYQRRYTDGRLAQAETIISEADDLEFEDSSLDAAMLVLTWHDFLYADAENGWSAIDEDLLIEKLCKAMKPGAVLGLIDHVANAGGDPAEVGQSLHRIDPQVVRDKFEGTCFTLEAEADFLRNADDDHKLSMGDKSVRGKTDRFVFKFVRQ
jgi:predicted methyltransferase